MNSNILLSLSISLCYVEQVKPESEEFEDYKFKEASDDQVKVERFNACDVEKVKTKSEKFEVEDYKEDK